jgi:hypothetical protein
MDSTHRRVGSASYTVVEVDSLDGCPGVVLGDLVVVEKQSTQEMTDLVIERAIAFAMRDR